MNAEDSRQRAGRSLARVMDLVRRLRAPDGCPWDQKQTLSSVCNYLLEEAYEAVEAVRGGQAPEARGELGDLAFQVVFLAELYDEAGQFDLGQALEAVHEKMVRRHPHVFGGQALDDAEAVSRQWGRIKDQERGGRAGGLLDSLPLAVPALTRAQRLGQRAARVGFDWPDAPAVWPKVLEELEELRQAPDQAQAQAELGDLFFSLAQWARHRGLNAEEALMEANQRFLRRFQVMESLAAGRGQDLEGLGLPGLDKLWDEAKSLEIKVDPGADPTGEGAPPQGETKG